MMKYILLIIASLAFFACSEDEFKTYTSDRYLFFTATNGVDSTEFSFTHFPLEEEHVVRFEVNLIGDQLEEDAPYQVYVIDSLSTAKPDQYMLNLNPIFHKNQIKDTLEIVIKKTDDLLEDVTLVVAIGTNENFQPGIVSQRKVKVRFNNVFSKPLWWKGEVQKTLGQFSKKKFEEFVKCTGESDLTGMSTSEIRYLALKFKYYVVENNIMDVDDNTGEEFPMQVPVS